MVIAQIFRCPSRQVEFIPAFYKWPNQGSPVALLKSADSPVAELALCGAPKAWAGTKAVSSFFVLKSLRS